MDPYLLQDLIESAPSSWPRLIARHEAASSYLALRTPSAEVAEQLAKRLGVGHLAFARLVCARKQQLKGKFQRRPYTVQRKQGISLEQEQIIQQALAEKSDWGVAATYKRALEISRESGVAAPTIHGVRSRFRTARSHEVFQTCAGEKVEWIVDACQLAVASTEAERVWLVVLVNVSTGMITAHCVAFGNVSPIHLIALLIGVQSGSTPIDQPTSIGVVPALNALLDEANEQVSQQGIFLLSTKAKVNGSGRGTSAGEMLMRLFGKKIGRIAFRICKPSRPLTGLPLASPAVIKSVIAELIERRNRLANAI